MPDCPLDPVEGSESGVGVTFCSTLGTKLGGRQRSLKWLPRKAPPHYPLKKVTLLSTPGVKALLRVYLDTEKDIKVFSVVGRAVIEIGSFACQ